jgi:hypothetical protein
MLSDKSTQPCLVCGEPAIVHIHLAVDRKWAKIHQLCRRHADEMLVPYSAANLATQSAHETSNGTACFDIEVLVVTKNEWDAIYWLREQNGSRRFSAKMGYCEAAALYLNLQHHDTPRAPGPYDALASTIVSVGAMLKDVLIHSFSEGQRSYRASLSIQQPSGLVSVNVRPSDAINLALICDVPISISENLLSKV